MGIKSFFWSLNRNNSNFIQIIRKFVYQEGEKKKLERGRKTLPHFCATLQTEPWGPMAVFQSRFFELGTDWSCSLLKPQAELLVCFLHWRARVFGVLAPTSGKTSIEMVSKELCWKLPQQLLIQSRMGCYSSHKSSPCWETNLSFFESWIGQLLGHGLSSASSVSLLDVVSQHQMSYCTILIEKSFSKSWSAQ